MPEMTAYEPGTPSWVDLGSPDVDATAAFYKTLFGWERQDLGPEAGGYGIFTLNGRQVAGVGPQQNPGPPNWTTYISTDDVDAAAGRVTAAGGMVFMPPMDVMEEGRMAIVADPSGAAFGMWQPRNMKGAELVNEAGTLVWNELQARDTSVAGFYEQVFGWKADTSEFGDSTYTQFMVNDRAIAGMMPMPPMVPAEVPSYWLVYFAVDDCDASVATASGAGASVTVPAMDIPSVGRFSVLTDPQGATFAVIKMEMQG